jgi:hypothetical protein
MKAALKTAPKGPVAKTAKILGSAHTLTARASEAPMFHLQPELGNHTIHWLFKSGVLQAKLAVGLVDDPLSRSVADQGDMGPCSDAPNASAGSAETSG